MAAKAAMTAMTVYLATSGVSFAQGNSGKGEAPTSSTQNVNVVNTPSVTVSSTAAAPLLVRDADYATRRPYVMFQSGSAASSTTLYFGTFQISNNTRKLFIIDNFRANVGMKGTDILMYCEAAIAGTAAAGGLPALGQQNFLVPAVYSGYNVNSSTIYYSTQSQTLLYLLPGHSVAVSCTRGGPNGTSPTGDGTQEYAYFNLTGSLIDVPAQ
jgi:hypothetical protein